MSNPRDLLGICLDLSGILQLHSTIAQEVAVRTEQTWAGIDNLGSPLPKGLCKIKQDDERERKTMQVNFSVEWFLLFSSWRSVPIQGTMNHRG
jgi:hypothetical protein